MRVWTPSVRPSQGGDWYHLVRAVVQHAVDRYGLAEVRDNWRFEVWNELWGMGWPDPYMTLYNHSAAAVKAVDPGIRVGGPATMQLDHVTDFVRECEDRGIEFDFVSTHMYPNDGMCPPSGTPGWNPDCLETLVKRARRRLPAAKPLLLTEYSVGCCGESPSSNSAALIFRAVGGLHRTLEVMSCKDFAAGHWSPCACTRVSNLRSRCHLAIQAWPCSGRRRPSPLRRTVGLTRSRSPMRPHPPLHRRLDLLDGV